MHSSFFVVFLFTFVFFSSSSQRSSFSLHILKERQDEGAVCLDGSPPGYMYRPGHGSGKTKWILYFQSGGWCSTPQTCLLRSQSRLGSSLYFSTDIPFGGLLSPDETANPSFFNWNAVFLLYCDGSSFTGDVSTPLEVEGTLIYFRGRRIMMEILNSLERRKSFQEATDILLGGCSAGGLAVFLHSDFLFQRLHRPGRRLKAYSESGFDTLESTSSFSFL